MSEDVADDVKRDAGVGEPCGSGVSEVVSSQTGVAEAPWVGWRLALFESDQVFAVGLDSIERVLELGARDVAEVAVEALRVVPEHPTEGGELEILDRPPRPGPGRPADEFGLALPVHRFGQGIVIAVTDGPDRRRRADLRESFAVANGRELRPRVAVTPQVHVVVTSGPAGHLDGVEDHLGAHVRRDPPPDDHAGERVDDEAHVRDTGPGRHERQIRRPEPVRSGRGELPLHQIRMPRRRRIRPGCLHPLRAPRALDPCHLHQPRGLVAADHDPRPPGRLPELADPVDPIVRLPQLDEPRDQLLVPLGAGGRSAGLGGVVAARSHLQLSADELDSEPATLDEVVLVRVDERDYLR